MFKLTPEEIKNMEDAVDNFEEASKKCEVLTEGGIFVRDIELNNKPCRICFIMSYVEDDEDDGSEEMEEN